jgi:hypothetical protein
MSNRSNRSNSSDGAAKHRQLVSGAIACNNVPFGVALLRKCHERGIDISVCVGTKGGYTIAASVAFAANKGRVDAIKLLHELGADINTPAEERGPTPVWIAASNGRTGAIRTLCELGADVNTPTNTGMTPVWMAAERGHVVHSTS